MIIERIQAENVLKYARLDLDQIPARGLIAVTGDNESGKSSIGESVCFALFGRTFSLGPDELDKVIRWGESRCAIKLDFRTPDGGRYQVARFLDELGSHGASISRPGEQPLVRGVEAVTERLRDLIGFGYPEFIESFYLAQREISTPKPHSDAVKAMAGIDVLERVAVECRREREHASGERKETARALGDLEAQLTALQLDPERLPTLERELAAAESAMGADRERIRALKSQAEWAGEAIGRLKDDAAAWLALGPQSSLPEYRSRSARLAALAQDLAANAGADQATIAAGTLKTFADGLEARLASLDHLVDKASAYRARLAARLGRADPPPGRSGAGPVPDQPATVEPSLTQELADCAARMEATGRGAKRARVIGLGLALPGLLAALAWFLLMPTPQGAPLADLRDQIATWLDARGLPWRPALPWLPGVAGALGLLALGLLVRGSLLGERLGRLGQVHWELDRESQATTEEYERLARLTELPLAEAVPVLGNLRDAEVAEGAQTLVTGPLGDLLDTDRHQGLQQALKTILGKLVECLNRQKAEAGQRVDALHEAVADHAAGIAAQEARIAEEQRRVRHHQELGAMREGLQAKQDALDHRIGVRQLAGDLLAGAIHYISQRFNTEVRNLSADSLPRFTNGRYQHLQIDQNLKVRAFSNEKRDFMDLDEISSGTQRQIMLAVRMALSQKLVNSVIQGPQMLFLDEPFAFFDETRTASALAILPQVSRDFTQIWVTSQTFPPDSHFDLVVECNARESHSPHVSRPTV
jgi:hypothetical protein